MENKKSDKDAIMLLQKFVSFYLYINFSLFFLVSFLGQCQVYGDPHYISFQGIPFDFMDNCTYTLVEERVLQHNLSITVDNYYCVPEIDNSCSRGITLNYRNDIATLMVTEEFTVEVCL